MIKRTIPLKNAKKSVLSLILENKNNKNLVIDTKSDGISFVMIITLSGLFQLMKERFEFTLNDFRDLVLQMLVINKFTPSNLGINAETEREFMEEPVLLFDRVFVEFNEDRDRDRIPTPEVILPEVLIEN